MPVVGLSLFLCFLKIACQIIRVKNSEKMCKMIAYRLGMRDGQNLLQRANFIITHHATVPSCRNPLNGVACSCLQMRENMFTNDLKKQCKSFIIKEILCKQVYKKMKPKTRVIGVRVDADFYDLIKKNSGDNISEYAKNLMISGMVADLGEMYEKANKYSLDSQQDLPQNNSKEITKSLNFLQQLMVNIALKQGFSHDEIKRFYRVANEENNEE